MALTDINSTLKNVATNLSQIISATKKLGSTIATTITTIRSDITTIEAEIAGLHAISVIPSTSWFVSAAGSDSNTGQSAGSPFLTIQHAINVILGYLFGGQVITLHVGAGSFAAFIMTGLGQGASGSGSLDELGIVLVGAGSGSTTIAAGSTLRGARLNLSACTADCTAAAAAFMGDAYSTLVLTSDVIFSGNSSSAIALNFNQFSSIIQNGNVTLTGTIGTYCSGFAFVNYEQNGGALTVGGGATVSTLFNFDIISNYHFFGGSVVVSGTTNGNAYIAEGQSIINGFGAIALDTIWTGGGGEAGVVTTGGRSESAVSAPTVASSGGTVALTPGSNAYSAQAVLTVTGGSPTAGTVSITVHEFLCYTPGVASTYVPGLQDDGGSWAVGASARISAVTSGSGGRTYTITWSNNGVGLANNTYIINLVGQT
jgi:hypothetical protein